MPPAPSLFDATAFRKLLDEGYVRAEKHPQAELWIYNYTARAQYDWKWNDITRACRGLIVDAAGNVAARPFEKFFNLSELRPGDLPDEPFEVYEKMDGSLGILYWLGGAARIATRGSFVSEQARRATSLLYDTYPQAVEQLAPSEKGAKGKTYLFEIVYPENRIVVNYGEAEKLVLLAVIDNATGRDLPLEDVGVPVVKTYPGLDDLSALYDQEEPGREGFVVRFESGFRVKVKFEEYVRLHRLVTNLSTKMLWEHLREGRDVDELVSQIPDEFHPWVKEAKRELMEAYAAIERQCREDFADYGTRKQNALYYKTCAHPSVLFRMLDGKSYSDLIWRLVEPEHERPDGPDGPDGSGNREGTATQ